MSLFSERIRRAVYFYIFFPYNTFTITRFSVIASRCCSKVFFLSLHFLHISATFYWFSLNVNVSLCYHHDEKWLSESEVTVGAKWASCCVSLSFSHSPHVTRRVFCQLLPFAHWIKTQLFINTVKWWGTEKLGEKETQAGEGGKDRARGWWRWMKVGGRRRNGCTAVSCSSKTDIIKPVMRTEMWERQQALTAIQSHLHLVFWKSRTGCRLTAFRRGTNRKLSS